MHAGVAADAAWWGTSPDVLEGVLGTTLHPTAGSSPQKKRGKGITHSHSTASCSPPRLQVLIAQLSAGSDFVPAGVNPGLNVPAATRIWPHAANEFF